MSTSSEIVGPRRGTPGAATAEVGTARLLLRFTVGSAELASEWLGSALRAIDRMPEPIEAALVEAGAPPVEAAQGEASGLGGAAPLEAPAPADEARTRAANTARAVLVGALSAALRWRPPQTSVERVARKTGRGLRLFAHAPGIHLVERRYRHAREGLAAQLQQWAEEGAREERAGRRLARLAAPTFFELAVARLADSPELRLVIEEQSHGLAATSVDSLREHSELADRLVERVIRRVLRRPSNGGAHGAPDGAPDGALDGAPDGAPDDAPSARR